MPGHKLIQIATHKCTPVKPCLCGNLVACSHRDRRQTTATGSACWSAVCALNTCQITTSSFRQLPQWLWLVASVESNCAPCVRHQAETRMVVQAASAKIVRKSERQTLVLLPERCVRR